MIFSFFLFLLIPLARSGILVGRCNMARALKLTLFGSLLFSIVSATNSSLDYDVLQYIDPLIGTGRGGHVFAGATLPFGESLIAT